MYQTPLLNWPPSYSLRNSSRAKYLSLNFSQKGLEVVIPKRKPFFLQKAIEALLQENRSWIERQLRVWQEKKNTLSEEPLLPDTFYFPSLNKTIQLQYHSKAQSRLTKTVYSESENIDILRLQGPIQDSKKCIIGLKQFLQKTAESYLLPWLNRLSIQTGFHYQTASVRHLSTLWGSCSSSHKICLNTKLLFLPSNLVEYVILHELCHLRILNHSKRFWNLLKLYDPLCLQHRKALRNAGQYIPRFLEEKLY